MSKHGYYDEGGHLKYVLTSKELTELAKEVGTAIAYPDVEPLEQVDIEIERIFAERGIQIHREETE